jgi:streptogramin lyase
VLRLQKKQRRPAAKEIMMSRFTNKFEIGRNISRRACLAALGLTTIMLGMSALVDAQPPTITEFPIPTTASLPYAIAAGPDGNVWFTEFAGNNIARITPAGVITEFPVPTINSFPTGITTGPDGNVWFTEEFTRKIGRITPAGVVTEFPVGGCCSLQGIAVGPDGNLWFTANGNGGSPDTIGRMTPAGVVTQFIVSNPAGRFLLGITPGPDGNLWFTEFSGNKIGQITPSGVITEFPVPTANSQPFGITVGPDGNLWFTESAALKIGKITTSPFTITEYPLGTIGSSPQGIAAGPDGNVWFVDRNASKIGQITPAGVITEFPTPTSRSSPIGISAGPDGNLWFTENVSDANNVGRVTLVAQMDPPTLAKAFGAASIPFFTNTTLTFTLTNPNSTSLTGVSFTDPLPAGLIVATPNGLTGSCGGTVTAVPGSSSVALTGGTIAASGSCIFSVTVTGIDLGPWTNHTGNVSADGAPGGSAASAGITVMSPPSNDCLGLTMSNLAHLYGSMSAAASALGFPSVQALHDAVRIHCGG